MWIRRLTGTARFVAQAVAYGLLGGVVMALIVFVVVLDSRPDLSVWHLADLDEEFTRDSEVDSFEQYLALEDRLFRQLDALVYDEVSRGPGNSINRYSRGSRADPDRWPVNWNRTFQLAHEAPRAVVLALHGLSDSPYSMRAIAERLHEAGASVVALRIPGHGTAPSGLVETRWQDMAAAVRLAAKHVRGTAPDKPFFLVGYSNGGALSVEYTLASLTEESLPRPTGVILLSPEIGVTEAAALAVWQGRIGHLLGLDKLAWNSITPEYDPFKYGSFAVNAGDLAHRITLHVQDQLDALEGTGKLDAMPPILAFQSSADATVTATALVENLFARLPPSDHELVLFDINRNVEATTITKKDPADEFGPLLKDLKRSFDLTLVGNESEDTYRVIARTSVLGQQEYSLSTFLGEWPPGIYSLSHVALPFAPTDAVYGGPDAGKSPGIQLGNLDLRGERGVLQISGTELLRLRWNPFFGYVVGRIMIFTELGEP